MKKILPIKIAIAITEPQDDSDLQAAYGRIFLIAQNNLNNRSVERKEAD